MTHLQLYGKLLDQGKESKLNEYLLFYNKLEDQQKIVTSVLETSHKEYEGSFTAKIDYPKAAKLLVKVNDNTNLRQGAALLLSTDA